MAPLRGIGGSLRATLRYGLPAHVGRLADIGVFRVDSLIVGAVWGARELGIYAAAVNLAEAALYFPTAVQMTLLPANVEREETAGLTTRRVLALVNVASVATAIVGALLAPLLVETLFGPEFAGSVIPLRILLLAMVGMSMRGVLSAALAAKRRQTLASLIAIATLISMIGLDFLLIPAFRSAGAAWASVAAYLLGALLAVLAFEKIFPSTQRTLSMVNLQHDLQAIFRAARATLRQLLHRKET
jgi:O-antigen/teichoic acid export membrane protein